MLFTGLTVNKMACTDISYKLLLLVVSAVYLRGRKWQSKSSRTSYCLVNTGLLYVASLAFFAATSSQLESHGIGLHRQSKSPATAPQ